MRKYLASLVLAMALLSRTSGSFADTASIWVRADGSNFMPRIVDAFNKGHSDQIKLSIIPNAEIIPKYGAAAAGGTAPDALSLDLIYTPAFSAAGQLEDITDWAKSLPYFAELSPAHVKTGTYKGRIYGLPFSADSSVLIWNKKLFKQAGLDPEKGPKTWAEIEADADELADAEEMLGVEIEITPAGKSTKRLSLLSGGEKSMTALAFMFSVFLARPCPFYVLDEVEAALDDLNLDRFLTLLRRYADRAQFIVITHQKRTMEAADWLYGVSMADNGVSKVLSRRLPREEPMPQMAAVEDQPQVAPVA